MSMAPRASTAEVRRRRIAAASASAVASLSSRASTLSCAGAEASASASFSFSAASFSASSSSAPTADAAAAAAAAAPAASDVGASASAPPWGIQAAAGPNGRSKPHWRAAPALREDAGAAAAEHALALALARARRRCWVQAGLCACAGCAVVLLWRSAAVDVWSCGGLLLLLGGIMALVKLQLEGLTPEQLTRSMRGRPPAIHVDTGLLPSAQVVQVVRQLETELERTGLCGRPRLVLDKGDAAGCGQSVDTRPVAFVRRLLTELAPEGSFVSVGAEEREESSVDSDELPHEVHELRDFLIDNFSAKPVTEFGLATTSSNPNLVELGRLSHGRKTSLAAPLQDRNAAKTEELLAASSGWCFNVFELAEHTQNHPLLFIGFHLFNRERLPEIFKIKKSVLVSFLRQVEASYNDVPYHNRDHSADVMQACSFLLNAGLREKVSDVAVLALLIAAAAHDMGHPGQNNAYHIGTQSELALLYNDRSVLENHHAAQLFSLLRKDECNILATLEPKQRRDVRALVVAMILGTDMACHFDKLDRLRALALEDGLDWTQPDASFFLLEMLLHCADVSNPCRPSHIYQQWMHKVTEEFYAQGDLEKQHGLPVSKFFDRDVPNVIQCQAGFVNVIVEPLFRSMSKVVSIEELLDRLEENKRWISSSG